jgi:dTDP-L-rhamnose 4-epimerase
MPDYVNAAAEFVQGDVRDKHAWESVLEGIDVIYHFAAYQDYLTDFSTFFHTNAVSTALLYEVLIEKGWEGQIRKVIIATSQAVMGEGRYRCLLCSDEDGPFLYPDIRLESQLAAGQWDHRCPHCQEALQWLPSDESVIRPCNQYALSKHSQEQIALQLGRRYHIPSVAMRYSIVQGPRQSFYNAYSGAMRIFALSLMLGRPPMIYEDGCQIRDFVNIADVVSANLIVLDNPEANNRIFNVGGGHAWTVNDFYMTMQRRVGKSLEPIRGGYYRFGDTRHIYSDTSALQALGWRPKKTVDDSIEAYWKYLQQQERRAEILEFSEKNMKALHVIRQAGEGI